MAITLTSSDILTIWQNDESRRDIQEDRVDYYNGKQDILDESDKLIDGSDRCKIVTNWIRYIVDAHVGFIASKPFSYTLVDSDASNEPLDEYAKLSKENSIPSINTEHLRTSILQGFSVEVHSYQKGKIVIDWYDPRNWAFLYDKDGNMLVAVYRIELKVGTYYNGKILDKKETLYTVYDNKRITTYIEKEDEDESLTLDQINVQNHEYGQIPIVLFACNQDMVPFITDDIITQQDAWNTIRSANADDVRYNVHALLMTKGFPVDAFYEKDSSGYTYWDKMQQNKHLPLPDRDCDAKFLTRGNEPDKVTTDLETTRNDLHRMGRVADIARVIGSTGRTSGIALKLKLQPQIEQASVFTKYFENGLRRRIELINIVWKKQKKQLLENYTITFNYNVPVAETEIWDKIGGLNHLLSREDQLRFVPSIDDPVTAAQNKLDEMARDLALQNAQITQEEVETANNIGNTVEKEGDGLAEISV